MTLGDGRTVECASGITRLPPGPLPDVLDCEVVRAEIVPKADRGGDARTSLPLLRRGYNRGDRRRDSRKSPEHAALRALFDN